MKVTAWLDDCLGALESREAWVWVGNGAGWLAALYACLHSGLYGATLTGFGVTLAACGLCQTFAVAVVMWPGGNAHSRDLAECHSAPAGLALVVVCMFFPVTFLLMAMILMTTGHDLFGEALSVVSMGVPAHLLATTASLVAVAVLVGRAEQRERRDAPPGGPDWSDAEGYEGGGTDG
ncbi:MULTISPECIES: hypothetical protein [unclassified Streptomyces]|uniref:hypothetical protein n=1 Tax=unclassified Streptomyces TaxID=2593676 RepID=UPI00344BAFDF